MSAASLETRVENLERFSTLPRVKRSRKGGSKKAGEDTREYCTICQRWLPRKAFPSNQRMSSGLSSHCQACHAESVREWRERNSEHVAVYNESRRKGPRECECVDCGLSFTAGKRGPAGERCRRCRRARKLRQPGRSGPYDSPTGQGGGDQPVGWLIPSHLQPARSGRTPPAPPEASLANVSAHFPSWSTTLMNLPS